VEDPLVQQPKPGAAIASALQEFQPVDLATPHHDMLSHTHFGAMGAIPRFSSAVGAIFDCI
jgi:hypothetical protein